MERKLTDTHLTCNKSSGAIALFLVIVSVLVLLPGTASLPLIDRDEPRFAQAAVEMMERGDWIIPTFNGDYRFDKPPLIYWMMIPLYAVGGITEWTARIPSILCALFLAWLIFKTGEEWFDRKTGILAAMMMLTHIQIIQHGRAAVADMPMILAVFVVQKILYERLACDRPDPYWFWKLYGGFALGFLAKGPVALLIPLLTLPLFWLLIKRPRLPWNRLYPLRGSLLVLLLVGAWGIPALLLTDGEFARIGLGKHVVQRGLDTFEGHGAPVIFYLLVTPLSMFPWSRFFPAGIKHAWKSTSSHICYLTAWVLVTFLLFSFYATKLPHYVMPCYPAVFLLLSNAMTKQIQTGRFANIWTWLLNGIMGVLIAILAGLSIWLWNIPGWSGAAVIPLGGALLFAGLMVTPAALLKSRWPLLAAALLAIGGGTELFARGIKSIHPSLQAARFLDSMPGSTTCGFYKYKEPSVVFYTQKQWDVLHTIEEIERFASTPGPHAVIIQTSEQRIDAKVPPITPEALQHTIRQLQQNGYIIDQIEGWNMARSSRVRLTVAKRPESEVLHVDNL